MDPIHYAVVKDGKIKVHNLARWTSCLSKLDGDVEIVVRKSRKIRSNQQNKLYWQYLNIISSDTGHMPEELHEYFKMKFNSAYIKFGQDEMKIGISTTNLDTKEFTDYLSKIYHLTGVPMPTNVEYE